MRAVAQAQPGQDAGDVACLRTAFDAMAARTAKGSRATPPPSRSVPRPPAGTDTVNAYSL
ncbi:hypothetical protein ACFTWH_29975 [Streptomyces sp. NPDC057011]|uniref:hypothetical protein n=1 Tax=unclassified Streptomyces TaxID=2593676 RepID=UPI003624E828